VRVSIMQPTYLPWCGYFDYIQYSDTLVFLDDVSLAQQRPNWQKENRILYNGEIRWLRAPVARVNGNDTLIKDAEYKENVEWRKAHLALLEEAYAKAPYFEEVYALMQAALSSTAALLADVNIEIIRRVGDYLGFKCDYARAAALKAGDSKKDHRLVEICRKLGATEYYSPQGSAEYIAPENFSAAGIVLCYQNLQHPVYKQYNNKGEFVPYLSVLDMLFNEGRRSADIIRSAHKDPLDHSAVGGI
jgi:hypothetical protein